MPHNAHKKQNGADEPKVLVRKRQKFKNLLSVFDVTVYNRRIVGNCL
jgi:hypothetical protein